MSDRLRTDHFDYDLPEEMIAQAPAEPRDSSRLLVLDRASGSVSHHRFHEIVDFMREGDLLVVNDTKVMASRLRGVREGSGGGVEALLLREVSRGTWEALVRPAKRLRPGAVLLFGECRAEVKEEKEEGRRIICFDRDVRSVMDDCGLVPLPPYVRTYDEELARRYQTVFAVEEASSAAPTAGLHFTPQLLRQVEEMGIRRAPVTLEIGWETFRPVRVDYVDEHRVHGERYSLGKNAAAAVNETKERGGRVIAIGTTSTRVLETAAGPGGRVAAGAGETTLFIHPGYQFKVVDALITNFHLPRTSLLMLVSAFGGREQVMAAYEEAVREGYRFYSFGDAMLIRRKS